MAFYAVYTAHLKPGVYTSWEECKKECRKRSKYMKFKTREEAEHFAAHGPHSDTGAEYDLAVYTDGACSKNGKQGAKAGYGVFFALGDARNECGGVPGAQTNNAAELYAILRAYALVKPELEKGKKVAIFTDSTYSIYCCGKYGAKCHKKNWVEPVPNLALVKEAFLGVGLNPLITLYHVTAHTNNSDEHSVGNHNADCLAKSVL